MKVRITSFGLPHNDASESHDAFEVKSWDETVSLRCSLMARGRRPARARRHCNGRMRSLVNHYETRPRAWTPQKALLEFTRVINRTLHQDSLGRFGAPELVTTLSVAVIEGDRLYGLNVGDSRVYLVHDGQVSQLSRDPVAGRTGLPQVLDKAIGLEAEIEPHLLESNLTDGDLAMLCSDGIFNALYREELADALRHRLSARVIVASAREQSHPRNPRRRERDRAGHRKDRKARRGKGTAAGGFPANLRKGRPGRWIHARQAVPCTVTARGWRRAMARGLCSNSPR